MMQVPPAPNGERCGDCRHWCRSTIHTLLVTPQGQPIPAAMIDQVPLTVRAGATKEQASWCTRRPQWVEKIERHWCGDFEPLFAAPVTTLGNIPLGALQTNNPTNQP